MIVRGRIENASERKRFVSNGLKNYWHDGFLAKRLLTNLFFLLICNALALDGNENW